MRLFYILVRAFRVRNTKVPIRDSLTNRVKVPFLLPIFILFSLFRFINYITFRLCSKDRRFRPSFLVIRGTIHTCISIRDFFIFSREKMEDVRGIR